MKKIPIFTFALLFFGSSALVVAPLVHAQSALNRTASKSNILVVVKGDRLAFASIADYKRAVDQPSEQTKKQFARTVAALKGFTSFAKKQNSSPTLQSSPDKVASLIQDEYFASILNADLVVQIGDHIFRINPSTERVYALSDAKDKEYPDLIAENVRNLNIRTFSTNDNVLELIEAKGMEAKKKVCTQSGIGGRHDQKALGGMTASADFARYGIYFTLFAMVSPYGSSGFPYTFEFAGGISSNQGNVYYHIRCGGTVGYAIATPGSWNGTLQKYQSYQGSTNLNQVYFFYRIKGPPNGGYLTPLVGFRVNK